MILPESRVFDGDLVLVGGSLELRRECSELTEYKTHKDCVRLAPHAAKQLYACIDAIGAHSYIIPVSGFRTFAGQQALWDETLKSKGEAYTRRYVAYPRKSEHHTGLAVDLRLWEEDKPFCGPNFPYDGVCRIFREKASEYGFIERYPAGKEDITGVAHEPWHFRYVGAAHARIMAENGMVLEEYIDFLRRFPYGERRLVAHGAHISYLSLEQSRDTDIEESPGLSVSGNNIDGFIITKVPSLSYKKAENSKQVEYK